MRFNWMSVSAAILLAALLAPPGGAQQKRAPTQPAQAVSGDWPLYRHDLAGTGYSPLAQITTQNVGGLVHAWSYRLESDTVRWADAFFEAGFWTDFTERSLPAASAISLRGCPGDRASFASSKRR